MNRLALYGYRRDMATLYAIQAWLTIDRCIGYRFLPVVYASLAGEEGTTG